MWIFVGLGNPGSRYALDRHNVGFRVVERLSTRLGISLQTKRWQSITGQGRLADQTFLLLQPQTYMNLSGEAVAEACSFFQIPPSSLLVIHDELDLPFGRLQLKRGGSDGGHRGIRSISGMLHDPAYFRLRFGIGRPTNTDQEIVDYVLQPFSPQEEAQLDGFLEQAVEICTDVSQHGATIAMNRWNRRKAPSEESSSSLPSPAPPPSSTPPNPVSDPLINPFPPSTKSESKKE